MISPSTDNDTVHYGRRASSVSGLRDGAASPELAKVGRASADVKRLLTIPGVDRTVALSLVAAIGEISRFPSSRHLVGYLGLDPRVRQSGNQPARHGRISKQGRTQARGMLVEAAWACAKTPGPLRAFFLRVRSRRGEQVAAVATARKLAVLCWHLLARGEDYAYARPSLLAQKLRALELAAGAPSRRGQRGPSSAYNLKEVRERERALSEQADLSGRTPSVGQWTALLFIWIVWASISLARVERTQTAAVAIA